jgi:hypothetical protein
MTVSPASAQLPSSLRVARAIAGTTLMVGLALLAMMVTTEGEPGLLPLLLVVGGAVGLAIAVRRIRRHRLSGG